MYSENFINFIDSYKIDSYERQFVTEEFWQDKFKVDTPIKSNKFSYCFSEVNYDWR